MADSPAVFAPVDPAEQPILERLITIRDGLVLIKQEKSTYVKSHDVIPFYDQAIEQVQILNQHRAGRRVAQNRGRQKAYAFWQVLLHITPLVKRPHRFILGF